jgi:hypothetical protein
MSDSASSRQNKSAAQSPRAPLFEARHKPLPPQPQPIQNSRDPFEDLPDVRPRMPLRTTFVAQPARPRIANEVLDAPLPGVRSPVANATADLHRAQLTSGYARTARQALPLPASQGTIFGLFQNYPWLFAIIAAVCLGVVLLASAPTRTVISGYRQPGGGGNPSESEIQAVGVAAPSTPDGQHSILGQPTISADMIDTVLAKFGSPAAGTGQIWIEMGKRYGINPAYALAFFIHESSAGTNKGWAGLKADGSTTHNIGNIICAGYATCYGGFRDYSSWDTGVEDWYKLILREYVEGRGTSTVEQILPIYCPTNDGCLPNDYIQIVNSLVDQWNQGKLSQ